MDASTIIPPATLTAVAQRARVVAREVHRRLETEYRRNYIAHREVEVLALDSKGERIGEADFIPLSKLNGATLRRSVDSLKDAHRGAAKFALQGGFDLWENFNEFCHRNDGWDYTPFIDTWDYEIPQEVV